jgi:hypothetical protein
MRTKEMVVMRGVISHRPETKAWEKVSRQTMRSEELDTPDEAADDYSCPVCGIELTKSNFDTPARDYYCPYCSTRQMPSAVRAA